jgi:phosphoribosylglycinamide formyltransferase-1
VRIGWLSTGRDAAACNLLADIVSRAQQDELALDVGLVFCNRERGEGPESDRFLDLAGRLGFEAITLSSAKNWHETASPSRAQWRSAYHEQVMKLLRPYNLGVLVLAGYMLIASPAMCRRYAILNLHPALPEGPIGMWQDVIWELLGAGATQTGAMINLVTPQLDRGPVISYDRFPITGGAYDKLWGQFRAKLKTAGLDEVRAADGESEPLFAAVRSEGEQREIPLLYQTIKQFVQGRLHTAGGAVFGEALRLPLDLTAEVTAELQARG